MIPEKLPDERIKAILDLSLNKDLTQEEIAERVGVSRASVAKYVGQRKRQLGPKLSRYLTAAELENLCEIIIPLIREKLREGNPSDSEAEGEDHKEESKNNDEEEKMSNGDVGGKVQEALDRKEMLDKLATIGQLSEKLNEALELRNNETGETRAKIDDLKQEFAKDIGTIKSNISDLCNKFPGLCSIQERIEEKLTKIENSKPKGVLGTDLSLEEFLKQEQSQKVFVEKYLGPAGRVRALELCIGPECAEIRRIAKEKGIKLQKRRQGGGMLGGEWEDIDQE